MNEIVKFCCVYCLKEPSPFSVGFTVTRLLSDVSGFVVVIEIVI